MPVGNSNGKHFEDDFEAAVEEVSRPIIKPTPEQSMDPMEIPPWGPGELDFDKELQAIEGIPVADKRGIGADLEGHYPPVLRENDMSPDEAYAWKDGWSDIFPNINPDNAGEFMLKYPDHEGMVDKKGMLWLRPKKPEQDPPLTSSLPDTEFSAKERKPRSPTDVLTGQDGKERYQTWPERAFRSLVDAFKLPGDVMSGKIDPSSPEAAGRAFELAGAMVFGPAPIARRAVDGTLGSFAGVKSKTFDKEAFPKVRELEAKGATREEIYDETGFFKGLDDKWRYEIKDHGMEFKTGQIAKGDRGQLSDYIEHPELFKAYPDLKNIEVRINQALHPEGANVTTINGKDVISLGTAAAKKKEVWLHEIQHVIQRKEGFAQGGTHDVNPKLRFDEAIDEKRKEFFKFKDDIKDRTKNLSEKELEQLSFYEKFFAHYAKYATGAREMAKENYMRLAGEVEARNVEKRLRLLEDYYPWRTEDRPQNLQKVILDPRPMTPYDYPPPNKPANDVDPFGKGSKNYEGALDNQQIKQLMTKDTKTGDFAYWQKIAEEEGHELYKSPNAFAAARAHSKDGKTTMIIEDDGRKIFYKDGVKVVREKRKNLKD